MTSELEHKTPIIRFIVYNINTLKNALKCTNQTQTFIGRLITLFRYCVPLYCACVYPFIYIYLDHLEKIDIIAERHRILIFEFRNLHGTS